MNYFSSNKPSRDRAIGFFCLVCGLGIIVVTLIYLFLQIDDGNQTRLLKNSHGNIVFGCVVALFGLERFVSEPRKMTLRKTSALICLTLLIQFWL